MTQKDLNRMMGKPVAALAPDGATSGSIATLDPNGDLVNSGTVIGQSLDPNATDEVPTSKAVYEAIMAAIGAVQIRSWSDIVNAVRLGYGPSIFPVGHEFSVPKETSISAAAGDSNTGVTGVSIDETTFLAAVGEAYNGIYEVSFDGAAWKLDNGEPIVLVNYGITITEGEAVEGDKIIITETANAVVFRVVDHDHYQAADSRLVHTMALETKYVYGTETSYKSLPFDAVEALYYAEEGLEAGSYYFTVKNQEWYPADNDVPYYFTLENDVPAGGQLVLSATYNQSLEGKSIVSYSSKTDTVAIETATLSSTEIEGSVNLGEPDGNTANMNVMTRAVAGSNNYAQSNVRQWLNSSGEVNTYYSPKTIYDRPASVYIGNDVAYNGFAHGFEEDFLAAVKPCIIPCRTNDIFETNSIDGTEFSESAVYNLQDKFFLLSRPEIFGTWDSESVKDGTQLAYYANLTSSERIKYDSFGTARLAWLRSPDPTRASSERFVNTDGSLGSNAAYNSRAASVACIIA